MTEERSRRVSAGVLAIAAVGYVAFTTLVTHLPLSPGVQHWAKRYDKVAHFGLYAVMVCLIGLALLPRRRAYEWGLLITYAILSIDEAWQAFVPTRHVDFWDWLTGIIGATCGWGCLRLWSFLRRSQ